MDILRDLDLSTFNCDYADVRIEDFSYTKILYKDCTLQTSLTDSYLAAFIRVFNNGAWYYSSTTDLNSLEEEINKLCKGSKVIKGKIPSFKHLIEPYNETLLKYSDISVAKISTDEKVNLCESCNDLLSTNNLIKSCNLFYKDWYKVKHFKSSVGTYYTYDHNAAGIRSSFSLVKGDSKFESNYGLGFISFDQLKKELFQRLGEEIEHSVPFVETENIKPGKYPLVMSSKVAGVFAHEAFGHKSEADNVLGDKHALEQWHLGKKMGSKILNIVDDGNVPDSCGYTPYDDEGIKNSQLYLIKDGILNSRLHSLTTSVSMNEPPTGNARAMDYRFEPVVRMTNTYFKPQNKPFEELLAGIKEGVYVHSMKHGSGLSTFTIAPNRAYRIKDGKIGDPIKVAVVSGSVFNTLSDIEDISMDNNFDFNTVGGCGKGEQGPLPVGCGGGAIRIKSMDVG